MTMNNIRIAAMKVVTENNYDCAGEIWFAIVNATNGDVRQAQISKVHDSICRELGIAADAI